MNCKLCKRAPGKCPIHNFYAWSQLPWGPPLIVISPLRVPSKVRKTKAALKLLK